MTRRRVGWDVLIAIVLISANLARTPHALRLHPTEPAWTITLGYLLACADLAAIAARRHRPVAALAVATTVPLVTTAMPVRPALIGLGIVFCAYTVAAQTSWPRAAVIVGVACAVHLAGGLTAVAAGGSVDGLLTFWGGPPRDVWTMTTGAAAAYFLPAIVGLTVRTRRVHRVETAARIEHDREERAAAAVAEERARIARELHDIAAHDLSAIVVQAGAADRMLDRDPEAVRATLRSIRAQGRDTLAALRTMVGLMREDNHSVSRAPQPTLARLDELIQQSRDTGLKIESSTTGAPCRIPVTVELAVFRLVQEALANAREHAPGASITVRTEFDFDEAVLRVAVHNDEPPRPPAPTTDHGRGHGLLGMRERVQHAGGTLHTGPRPGGGWQVTATFPTDRTEQR